MPEELNNIVNVMVSEGWDFRLTQSDEQLRLDLELFNGLLTLRADGTWEYNEA
jgi:hypothetical protein